MSERTSIQWIRGAWKPGMAMLAVPGLLVCGCSTIDYSRRVDGWPALTPEIRRVSYQEMRANCDKYSPSMEIAFACSEFFLDEGVCRVWIAGHSKQIEDHELAHCAGYDHPGGKTMRGILAQWNASKSPRVGRVTPDGAVTWSPGAFKFNKPE